MIQHTQIGPAYSPEARNQAYFLTTFRFDRNLFSGVERKEGE